MENTPVTQEIFSAFMKCLNQYDFGKPFNQEEKEVEVDEHDQITQNYLSDMEQLRLI